MRATSVQEIAGWMDGEILQGRPADAISGYCTDSRKAKPGEVFVALKGEKHDAHEFLGQVIEKGASAVVVHALPSGLESFGGAIIRVHDTLQGLQEWARAYRLALGLPVIGITGSSGKTSTKDFCRAALGQKLAVHATAGNLNNHFGVPMTLLQLEERHEVAIVEMGMNHAGEIEVLADIAVPDGAIITNIGTAHIENLGSREAIAEEKGMLPEAIGPEGWVVLPARDDFTASIRERCRGRVVTAGIGAGEVQARDLSMTEDGCRFGLDFGDGVSHPVRFPIAAEHMVANATLAAAAALECGVPAEAIAAGLEAVELTGGRLETKRAGGLRLLDDSYNANPESMRAALKTLRDRPVEGRRIAVLGLMAELGEFREAEHRALGEAAVENGVDFVLGIGEEGRLIGEGVRDRVPCRICADQREVAEVLADLCDEKDLILLKGSRSARMELVLSHLSERD